MSSREEHLKILLSSEERHQLDTLAHHLRLSRAEVVRQSITWRHTMQLQAQPLCANGGVCKVAALHTYTKEKARFVEEPNLEETAHLVGPPLPARFAAG